MHIGSHEYANEANGDNNVPKPAQSLGTLVLRHKIELYIISKLVFGITRTAYARITFDVPLELVLCFHVK